MNWLNRPMNTSRTCSINVTLMGEELSAVDALKLREHWHELIQQTNEYKKPSSGRRRSHSIISLWWANTFRAVDMNNGFRLTAEKQGEVDILYSNVWLWPWIETTRPLAESMYISVVAPFWIWACTVAVVGGLVKRVADLAKPPPFPIKSKAVSKR